MRALPEWVGKTDNAKIPDRVRLRVFERNGGRCYCCDTLIRAGMAWDCDHVVALINGGKHREWGKMHQRYVMHVDHAHYAGEPCSVCDAPERIPLDEFDGLRRYLWNIEAQADHLAAAATRLSVAVDELPKRPEWTSKAEDAIDSASLSLQILAILIQHTMADLDNMRLNYRAKKPFI